MHRLIALLLFAVASFGQAIEVDFFLQDGVTIGRYQQYSVTLRNGSDQVGTILGAYVWALAQNQNRFVPQLTSNVLAEQDFKTKTSKKATALRIIAAASAGIGGAAAANVFGNLSPDSAGGKAVAIGTPIIAAGLVFAAETVDKVPERQVDAKVDRILPGRITLPPHESAEYIMWGIPK